MPDVILPFPEEGRNLEETVRNLFDTVIKLRKELEFLLRGNLDEDNVMRAQQAIVANALIDELIVGENVQMGPNAYISWNNVTGQPFIPQTAEDIGARPDTWMPSAEDVGAISSTYIDENGVFTPQVYATNINVLRGKITTAQIVDLIVGGNVTMGPNATISWSQVTNQPYIPPEYTDAQALAAWANSGYATYIDANGVYSGSFNGGMFNINPTGDPELESGITIGGYFEDYWTGEALKIQYQPDAFGFPRTVFSSDGGVDISFETNVRFENYVYFDAYSYVYFWGTVDFSGADVINLVAKFG